MQDLDTLNRQLQLLERVKNDETLKDTEKSFIGWFLEYPQEFAAIALKLIRDTDAWHEHTDELTNLTLHNHIKDGGLVVRLFDLELTHLVEKGYLKNTDGYIKLNIED